MQYQVVGDRIVCGSARFSALSQGLIRLEWSATGQFEDRPTVQAMTRPQALPFQAIAWTEAGALQLQTELIQIHYRPDTQSFNDNNLQIEWRCGTQKGSWTPTTVDSANLGGTFCSLDLIHRNLRPTEVHPAAVERAYPYTQEWLYNPMKKAHLSLRDRGETTRFEEPPLWYLDRHRQEELPEEVRQVLQEWQRFPPGILSRSGYSVLNDSASAPLENNWLAQRFDPESQDWYFFAYGSDYAQALQNFVQLCGPVPMLPRWAFGVWFSLFGQLYDTDYHNLVKQFEALDLPLDVLILDVDWHLSGWCGWDWNPEFFPDAPTFLKQIHGQELHVGANVHPEGLAPGDSQFQALCEARGLDPDDVKAGKVFAIRNPMSSWIFESWHPSGMAEYKPTQAELETGWLLFNLAEPEEARLFMQVLHGPREADGIDFWWIDGSSAIHPGVNSQLWTNHVYFTHLANRSQRPMILSRTGGMGSHRYPAQFSADTYSQWEVLQLLVDFTARAGNVGVAYWSHDLGGFYNHVPGVPYIDPELYVRWVQFGCWSPVVRLHSDHGKREPWTYGQWVLDAVRQAFQTRVQFLPYFYHLSRMAYETGLPLCRPLYLHYPKDPVAYEQPTQYLLGDRVLVAPVVEAGGYRSIYLPVGGWWHRETCKFYRGAQQLDLYVPLHQVPVFVKAGAILPLQPMALRAGNQPAATLLLEVYAGDAGDLDFYEDDGMSQAYLHEAGSRRRFTQQQTSSRHILTCEAIRGTYTAMPAARDFQVHWIGLTPHSRVTIQGAEISDLRWIGDRLEVTLPQVPQAASWQLVVTEK
ncbi:TIM-barrel domain-containing protein [Trichocoleus sp. FACHB-262]|uniref:glycoside hydrolase family 31 protein n=1 Tax=Trichocoleus sp. FACHB-262 TaxID=2692869 RepID=UPI0016850830|nr:TIM-barrel domain-containing protein [Trichocoleus sp. FACHB-262]MBD2120816.1 DUF5110 domain-containing protein [Trichocoleus sp. FACHB-262]